MAICPKGCKSKPENAHSVKLSESAQAKENPAGLYEGSCLLWSAENQSLGIYGVSINENDGEGQNTVRENGAG